MRVAMAVVLKILFVFLAYRGICFPGCLPPIVSFAHPIDETQTSLHSDGVVHTLLQNRMIKRESSLISRATIYWDCDMDEEQKLMTILNGVEVTVRKTLNVLQNPRPTPYEITKYAYHFGSPGRTRDLVAMRYLGVLRAVILPQRVSIRCINPPEGRCHVNGRILLAYPSDELPIIWLCPRFWDVPYFTLGYKEDQVSTLVHQLTRLRTVMAPVAVDTPIPREGSGHPDPWQGVSDRSTLINNAYSYEWFAKDLILLQHLESIGFNSAPPVRGSWT